MTIFGIDVSGYQPNFDFARARSEGFDFAFIKACEGDSGKGYYTNPSFAAQLAAAQSAGFLVAAYHYVQAGDPSGQVALIARTVPAGVPVIMDVETGGDLPTAKSIMAGVTAHGYRSPLIYLPRWWWTQAGSPPLAGLPPLWTSRYPDSAGGAANAIYARAGGDDGYGWQGYGGLDAVVTQFSSTALVAGTQVDVNAYRGTRDQLAALLAAQPGEGFLMALEDWQQQRIFDRILSMSMGVAGQNFDGDQFAREQQQRDRIEGYLANLAGQITDVEAALLGAIKAIAVGGTPTPPDLASLAKSITAALPPGVTLQQLAAALSTTPTS